MGYTAIVTGAAGGIGFAVTQALYQAGWEVLAAIHTPSKAACFAEMEDRVHWVCADIGTTQGRKQIMDQAETFVSIDLLVNVAGIAPKDRADLLEMTEDSFDAVMAVNTKGTFFLTQAVANRMVNQSKDERRGRGQIVNISSVSAYASSTNRGEYCISKAGVSMITKLFADRLAGADIGVNEIRPGIIQTDMTAKVKEKYDSLINGGLLPIARWGTPEDVARAVMVFADGNLRYTTGQSIDVDGGFHIRRL